jgi:hypothetical protein
MGPSMPLCLSHIFSTAPLELGNSQSFPKEGSEPRGLHPEGWPPPDFHCRFCTSRALSLWAFAIVFQHIVATVTLIHIIVTVTLDCIVAIVKLGYIVTMTLIHIILTVTLDYIVATMTLDIIVASDAIAVFVSPLSFPVMCKEHLWNFNALQRVCLSSLI